MRIPLTAIIADLGLFDAARGVMIEGIFFFYLNGILAETEEK